MITLPFFRYNPADPTWLDYSEVQVHYEPGRIVIIHDGENEVIQEMLESSDAKDPNDNKLLKALAYNEEQGTNELKILAQLWCASMDSLTQVATDLDKIVKNSLREMVADENCIVERNKIDGVVSTIRNLARDQVGRVQSELIHKYSKEEVYMETFLASTSMARGRFTDLERSLANFDRIRENRLEERKVRVTKQYCQIGSHDYYYSSSTRFV